MANIGTTFSQLPTVTDLNGTEIFPLNQGGVTKTGTLDQVWAGGFQNLFPATIEFVLDGGGLTLTTGLKVWLEIPFNCSITRATMLGDNASGSIVADVWVCAEGSFPPTVANTITGGNPPTITNAITYQDSTLTGWTTSLTGGNIIAVNINSVSTFQLVTLSLLLTRSV